MGPNVHALGLSPAHLGAGQNRGEVLRPKTWFFPLCPGIEQVEWLAQQGSKGHRIPDNGATARILRSVYFDHSLPPGSYLPFPQSWTSSSLTTRSAHKTSLEFHARRRPEDNRTVSTGQGDRRTTLSATLPKRRCSIPVRP